ncbi:PilZ domain-containing protein [Croceicoccus gelatinilyticus]|uniref:PilZ domain-containing protein n=1 Tax=Croceicoccus gelatinilyticus TaxID=2835536 RepID=UPI001BCCCBE4|nr:PilZ domain-containing protein [Croceicoccus gelatinilyticus]
MQAIRSPSKTIVVRAFDRVRSDRLLEGRSFGRQFNARLCDISKGGCKLQTSQRFDTGVYVNLKVDGGIRFSGTVVWQKERFVGIKFDQILHEAVVHFLSFSVEAHRASSPNMIDRFGRSLPKLKRNYRPSLCPV